MSALALKTALRGRLVADAGVLALVPADDIRDSNGRPEQFPCALIGEVTVAFADDFESFATRAFLDVHLWAEEPGLSTVQAIADAIRKAVKGAPWTVAGHRVVGMRTVSARFIRDPSGVHGHGIVTIEGILQELPA